MRIERESAFYEWAYPETGERKERTEKDGIAGYDEE